MLSAAPSLRDTGVVPRPNAGLDSSLVCFQEKATCHWSGHFRLQTWPLYPVWCAAAVTLAACCAAVSAVRASAAADLLVLMCTACRHADSCLRSLADELRRPLWRLAARSEGRLKLCDACSAACFGTTLMPKSAADACRPGAPWHRRQLSRPMPSKGAHRRELCRRGQGVQPPSCCTAKCITSAAHIHESVLRCYLQVKKRDSGRARLYHTTHRCFSPYQSTR